MTDEEIKAIAQQSGMEEFWGTRDDGTNFPYWEGWEDQMLNFARALLDPLGQPTREERRVLMPDSITPSPELVNKWTSLACEEEGWEEWNSIATQAAQWGADQELEACCEVLARELICDGKHVATDLRMIRRPNPPSLKEQALEQLREVNAMLQFQTTGGETSAIRRAIEALPND